MKRMVLFLIALFLWTGQLLAAEDGLQAAFQVVVNGPLQGDTEGIRVFGLRRMTSPGMKVEGWLNYVTLPEATGYLFFVDDLPEANWEHPARLVFVYPVDGSFKVYSVRTPPKIFSEFIEMVKYTPKARPKTPKSPGSGVRPPGNPNIQDSGVTAGRYAHDMLATSSGDSALVMGPDHKFAVLISGGYDSYNNWPRYWNDVSFMYKTLKYKYGYKDENIYVLSSDGLNPAPDNLMGWNSNPDLDGDGYPDIDFSATRKNLGRVFDILSKQMTAEDLLFVFTNGHGGQIDPDTDQTAVYLALWHDIITDKDLAAEVNKIRSYDTMVFVMEPCNSGGFYEELAGPNRIFISAAAYDKLSYGNIINPNGKYFYFDLEHSHDAFAYLFITAMAGARADGGSVRADMDADWVVSIAEAFSFAETNDLMADTPQFRDQSISAEIDPLMGANVVSLDGRFGTSFIFGTRQDVVNYSINMRGGSSLKVFLKAAPSSFGDMWKVSLGEGHRQTGWASGSPLDWFSPAAVTGDGSQTAIITYGAKGNNYEPPTFPSTGFVKFVLSGERGKKMAVTYQP